MKECSAQLGSDGGRRPRSSGSSSSPLPRGRRPSFARATAALDQVGLNIVDARITPTQDGASLDTYYVLEEDSRPISEPERLAHIEATLRRVVSEREAPAPTVTRRAPRQVRMFSTTTQVAFSDDEARRWTILELVAADRPGLLSEVGKVLLAERVDLVTARILTVGERAEDVFHVTDDRGQPLSDEARGRLQEVFLGSTAERVLDRIGCDVLVVKPGDFAEKLPF